jgi:hypothetical protein
MAVNILSPRCRLTSPPQDRILENMFYADPPDRKVPRCSIVTCAILLFLNGLTH